MSPHVMQVMSRACRCEESYVGIISLYCDMYIVFTVCTPLLLTAVTQFEEVKKKYIEEYQNVSQHDLPLP